jgi:lipoprotein-anchoring transpeptidase ErfK/SrfK
MMPVPALGRREFIAFSSLAALSACAPRVEEVTVAPPSHLPDYGPITDSGINLPAIPSNFTEGVNRRITGQYLGEQPPGTIDVDPYAKFLYLVREGDQSVRYPIGAGRAGRAFSGDGTIQVKKMWPGWTPTANMLRSEPGIYGPFARGIPGGRRSPLGARALYLYKGGRDTHYRIHGTNDLESVGNSGSAGCIRMFNHDIIHLFDLVEIGMRVHVRSEAESLRVDPENFNRGYEIPARSVDPDEIYSDEAIANDPPPVFGAAAIPAGDDVPL